MARGVGYSTRETASIVRETAADRTFTEEEHLAILADRVQQECASRDTEIAELKAQVESLTAEKAALQDKVDVAEAAQEAAEAAKTEAETALADFKAEVEREAEVAKLRDERVAKMREVLPNKPDEFFEERAQAWAEKPEEEFTALVADFAEVAAAAGPAEGRETAMKGEQVTSPEKAAAGTKSFYGFFKGSKKEGA